MKRYETRDENVRAKRADFFLIKMLGIQFFPFLDK